ncbi:hypothetical protein BT96DRAFT_992419 [Gymnopus androsaceus JB14]|uniref:Zn(2)-C6 fungal-type domain-containing protein n=1 Tax=Gymnopus androsaceus JB14 TaxID=1447944 RepID=A0A6A4HTK4_9AGAR|nr:hypothetical protein BT96DRAFT_992419 [Gymnopus androsaceus JB14]
MSNLFPNAQGFTIDGSGISQVAGDQNVYHNYGPTAPFSIRIESALDNRSVGNPWRYRPRPLPSLSDPTLPASSRYSLLLLSAKEGYPLWTPEPKRLPEEYRRTGVRIGDVGIIRPDGFFDYLFNICLPRDHPVNAGLVPEGFTPVEISQADVSEVDPFHDPDAHVASPIGYISKNPVHSRAGQSRTYDFMSMNSEGAILMLPDGSTRVDLENKKIFRQCANRNAYRWFTYVENTRGRDSHGLSLYVVTGSDRSSSFGVASFYNPQDQELNLRFNINEHTHLYSWSNCHYAESRSGPRFRPGDQLGIDRPPNHSVFIRGFKINKRQSSKGKEPAPRVGTMVRNDQMANTVSYQTASTSQGGSSSSQQWPANTGRQGRTNQEENMEVDYVPSHTAPYHPCDTINGFMLDLLSATSGSAGSGPSFAISHDDDWRTVWDEGNPKLPSEQELIRRICSKSKFVVDNGTGTIYPDPLDDVVPRKSSSLPEEAIAARVLVVFTCPIHNCGEQFQQQELLFTHMQQKHDVVHGTAARVPLSAAKASTAASTPKPPSQPDKKKRRGGVAALSCAECRRLKLKCSRTFPCTGCVKKGCSAICPDGHLTTGKGNRFVLANTNELQDKIVELTNRAKVLEEALAKSHSVVSPQPHPLLSDDLLQIKRPIKAESPEPNLSVSPIEKKEEKDQDDDEDEGLIVYNSSLGSLVIGQRNTFYGRSGTAWHFLLNESKVEQSEKSQNWAVKKAIPNDLPWLVHSFPFSEQVDHSMRRKLIAYLPKAAVARRHCQNFFRYGAWQYTPISETEFKTTIFQPWYEPDATPYEEDPLGSHNLAVLFLVLALGALLDLEAQSHSPEAKWYYQLGRAALGLESVLDSSSLSTIQALVLLSFYMLLDDIHNSRWAVMGLASKLTQSAGLHIDGTHWNLPPEETYRRRCLFWEVYSYDILQGLTYGRPPQMSVHYIDTKKPFETTRDANGEVEMTCKYLQRSRDVYAAWKHKFFSECLGVIWNKAFGAHPLSYEMLKHLDQQMRAYYVPPSLRVPGFGGAKMAEDHPPSPELTMARHFLFSLGLFGVSQVFSVASFYMHRGFFATAMNENPENPIEHHRYGESVQTIYDSACICRFSYFFDHIFSCAYVLGSIAAKPKVHLALSALTNLELAYDLFDATDDSPRRTKILIEIDKLRTQARLTLNVTQNPLTPAQKLTRPKSVKTEESIQGNQVPLVQEQPVWGTSHAPPTSSPTSSHQYSPTVERPAFHDTYNPHHTPQYPVDQYPLYPPSQQQQLQQQSVPSPQQYSDPFFQHPQMAYNPMSGYHYHNYQDAGYIQPQMEYQYDASGDVAMPLLEENWQNWMTQFRQ